MWEPFLVVILNFFLKVGDRVSAYTTKMEETDAWFEEKTVTVENLDNQVLQNPC